MAGFARVGWRVDSCWWHVVWHARQVHVRTDPRCAVERAWAWTGGAVRDVLGLGTLGDGRRHGHRRAPSQVTHQHDGLDVRCSRCCHKWEWLNAEDAPDGRRTSDRRGRGATEQAHQHGRKHAVAARVKLDHEITSRSQHGWNTYVQPARVEAHDVEVRERARAPEQREDARGAREAKVRRRRCAVTAHHQAALPGWPSCVFCAEGIMTGL